MANANQGAALKNRFTVTSIEKTDPPPGAQGGEWYEYVVGTGTSAITGRRSGSRKEVAKYVEEYAGNLNQRSALGFSAYAPRKPGRPAKASAS